MGIGTLFDDFFSNYFSFDSKIARSTIPFVLIPGVLTNHYIQGRRAGFVNPLRLYLIITFIFFFLLALLIDKVIDEEKISLLSDSNGVSLNTQVSDEQRAEAQSAADSVKVRLAEKGMEPIPQKESTATTRANEDTYSDWGKIRWENSMLIRDNSLSDEQVIDSLKLDKKSEFSKILVHQTRRVLQKDVDVFLPYLAKNFSLLMFLLLPIFALYLYVLFGRREKYYISHAIHALHLHAFGFLVLSLLLLLDLTNLKITDSGSLYWLAFLLMTFYAFFSIKRVYRQSWGKTIIKFNILGFFYFLTLAIGVITELLVSFVLF